MINVYVNIIILVTIFVQAVLAVISFIILRDYLIRTRNGIIAERK